MTRRRLAPSPATLRANMRGRPRKSITQAEAPGAALQTVMQAFPEPAERSLKRFFASVPAFGRRDRLAISDTVFDVLRHRRIFEALALHHGLDPASMAALVEARMRLVASCAAVDGPAADGAMPWSAPQRVISLAQAVLGDLSPAVRYSLPDWLWEALLASHGERAADLALALLSPAPVDIRVNGLRSRPTSVAAAFEAAGIVAAPIEGLANGLRVQGRPPLETLPIWREGGFELQDAGSQRIVELIAPRQGQTIIDFCAGAGGKALAIAARMRNIGQVYAFDTVESRLTALRDRAGRAGADIVLPMRIESEEDPRLERYRGRADIVLVDAPCSGSGTLRRHPDLKWRLTEADVERYVGMQQRILEAAARLVRFGGTLVYATCSVLDAENFAQCRSFDVQSGVKMSEVPTPSLSAGTIDMQWLPGRDDADGFFIARWSRQADGHYNHMVTHQVTTGVSS